MCQASPDPTVTTPHIDGKQVASSMQQKLSFVDMGSATTIHCYLLRAICYSAEPRTRRNAVFFRCSSLEGRGKVALRAETVLLDFEIEKLFPAHSDRLIDGVIADFQLLWVLRVLLNRELRLLATVGKKWMNIIEDLKERDLAHIPSCCLTQVRIDGVLKLLFRHRRRDAAHRVSLASLEIDNSGRRDENSSLVQVEIAPSVREAFGFGLAKSRSLFTLTAAITL